MDYRSAFNSSDHLSRMHYSKSIDLLYYHIEINSYYNNRHSPQISVPASVSGIETTLESIYARVNPSVVLIQVVLPESDFNLGGGAQGSGFVWDTQGDIVTNNHVIDGATRITVTFSDGTVVDANLVGADSDSDLAVIKVNPNGLTTSTCYSGGLDHG